jgi:hypothetical protein
MKMAVLTLSFFVLATVAASQNTSSGNSHDSNDQPKTETVRGCLSRTDHTYVLLGGNPIRQYRIIGGDISALKGKDGHTVAITGTVGKVKSGASSNGVYGPDTTTGVGYDTIRATRVKEIAPTCS